MIVVLTGNFKGGILHFARQIDVEFKKLGKETAFFIPSNAESIECESFAYKRKNKLNPYTKYYRSIANDITKLKPELVFVCDSNLVTARIVLEIERSIPVCMCIHDAKAHPNYKAVSQYIKDLIKKPYIYAAWRRTNKIVVMSENTKKQLKKMHPKLMTKVGIIRLGAHPPKEGERCPEEIVRNKPFYLFFGRIDKYKGVGNLLDAYTKKIDTMPYDLIIAGEGIITESERKMISDNSGKITLLKRYIANDEMVWLFKHARCIVLPYIEASQSGVLSMAYYFEKQVIASNLEGLKEFIDVGRTGIVYENIDQLGEYLLCIDQIMPEDKNAVKNYVIQNLNWSVNIRRCLQEYL